MAKWRRSTIRAWTYPFGERSWTDVRSFLGGMAALDSNFQYLIDVVDSVLDSGASEHLAVGTAMHDLMVTPHPVDPPVSDLVVVRAPSSLRPAAAAGHVRIERLSGSGRNDSIDRPSSEAVPLFWRFVIEKYGIRPPDRSA
ncbi:hypothetical protein [Kribbella sp. CA-247076]|uniref:hypothetical protein n=1 Tax=Kribbella sp. CA-247076 TaxID=3239941 RepID=UPI003D89B685